MIKYKLLNGGFGVLATRKHFITEGDVPVHFEGAPDTAVAVIESPCGTSYRTLNNGDTEIPYSILSGNVDIRVVVYDGSVSPKTWKCEGLCATDLSVGSRIVVPNDENLPEVVRELKRAHDALHGEFVALEQKFERLNERFTSMMEGYDLV